MSQTVYDNFNIQVTLLNPKYAVVLLPVVELGENHLPNDEILDVDTELFSIESLKEDFSNGIKQVLGACAGLKNGDEKVVETKEEGMVFSFIYGVDDGNPYLSIALEFKLAQPVEIFNFQYDEVGIDATYPDDMWKELFEPLVSHALKSFQEECGVLA